MYLRTTQLSTIILWMSSWLLVTLTIIIRKNLNTKKVRHDIAIGCDAPFGLPRFITFHILLVFLSYPKNTN